MRTGDPLQVMRIASWDGVPCTIQDCGKEVESKGLCNRHYLRMRIHGDPLAGGAFRVREHSMYCSIDDCDREFAALGYCSLHLKRFYAHGDPLTVLDRSKGKCSVNNCERDHLAKGFCGLHYDRWMKHGDPFYEVNRPSECIISDCHGNVMGHGYCQLHYTRVRKWGDPHYFQKVSDYKGALCSIEGCNKKVKSKGWCELHYDRFHTHGDPMFSMWEIDMDVPTTLYRLYSEQGELLYVGISVRVEQRMYEHSQSKWWWLEVEHQVLTQCPTRREALELEELAIKGEKPKFNITHNQELSVVED
jgi:predicted GIY-YIG superfamily endonuclease